MDVRRPHGRLPLRRLTARVLLQQEDLKSLPCLHVVPGLTPQEFVQHLDPRPGPFREGRQEQILPLLHVVREGQLDPIHVPLVTGVHSRRRRPPADWTEERRRG